MPYRTGRHNRPLIYRGERGQPWNDWKLALVAMPDVDVARVLFALNRVDDPVLDQIRALVVQDLADRDRPREPDDLDTLLGIEVNDPAHRYSRLLVRLRDLLQIDEREVNAKRDV